MCIWRGIATRWFPPSDGLVLNLIRKHSLLKGFGWLGASYRQERSPDPLLVPQNQPLCSANHWHRAKTQTCLPPSQTIDHCMRWLLELATKQPHNKDRDAYTRTLRSVTLSRRVHIRRVFRIRQCPDCLDHGHLCFFKQDAQFPHGLIIFLVVCLERFPIRISDVYYLFNQ